MAQKYLNCDLGYSYSFRVYTEKGKSGQENTTPSNIVMDLCKDVFHKYHILCTNNWWIWRISHKEKYTFDWYTSNKS